MSGLFCFCSTSEPEALDYLGLPESEVLQLGISMDQHNHTFSLRLGWPTALTWDIAQNCRSLGLSVQDCTMVTKIVFQEARAKQNEGQPSALPGKKA